MRGAEYGTDGSGWSPQAHVRNMETTSRQASSDHSGRLIEALDWSTRVTACKSVVDSRFEDEFSAVDTGVNSTRKPREDEPIRFHTIELGLERSPPLRTFLSHLSSRHLLATRYQRIIAWALNHSKAAYASDGTGCYPTVGLFMADAHGTSCAEQVYPGPMHGNVSTVPRRKNTETASEFAVRPGRPRLQGLCQGIVDDAESVILRTRKGYHTRDFTHGG
ncbi:hypothetical protein BKA70DRAFT_1238876 [Coprinopsis sp. MPI-PUGE-AT-0042]|nr:hypothetical protein BKA70DRAFT_1238876 [Coprinopsis sp. MPI-PUGE-AT-0042]